MQYNWNKKSERQATGHRWNCHQMLAFKVIEEHNDDDDVVDVELIEDACWNAPYIHICKYVCPPSAEVSSVFIFYSQRKQVIRDCYFLLLHIFVVVRISWRRKTNAFSMNNGTLILNFLDGKVTNMVFKVAGGKYVFLEELIKMKGRWRNSI